MKRRLRLELAAREAPETMAAEVRKRLGQIARARSFDWRKVRDLAPDLEAQRRLIVDQVAKIDAAEALEPMWRFMDLAGQAPRTCVRAISRHRSASFASSWRAKSDSPHRWASRRSSAIRGHSCSTESCRCGNVEIPIFAGRGRGGPLYRFREQFRCDALRQLFPGSCRAWESSGWPATSGRSWHRRRCR